MNGSSAAEDTVQTFQDVQLEVAHDQPLPQQQQHLQQRRQQGLDSETPSPQNLGAAGGDGDRGERLRGEISMLSPMQQNTTNLAPTHGIFFYINI